MIPVWVSADAFGVNTLELEERVFFSCPRRERHNKVALLPLPGSLRALQTQCLEQAQSLVLRRVCRSYRRDSLESPRRFSNLAGARRVPRDPLAKAGG